MRSRNKVRNNHFVKSVQKQPYADFFKIDVLKIFTQVFSHECCKIFKSSIFIENSGGCFFQFDKVTVQYWASADLLVLIKNTMWDGFYEKGLQ